MRVVLDGLALWAIVEVDQEGVYALGPAAPEADATAVLRHHARAIRNCHLAVHTFLRRTDELATIFSAQMLGGVAGGDSHTEDEFRRWLDQAGYRFVATQQLRRRPEGLLFASPANS